MNSQLILEKLWLHTITNETGCRLWQGAKTSKGYGQIIIDGEVYYTHRVSAFIYFGLDLSTRDKQVLHDNSCPNKNCWAPDHIRVGEHYDNVKDLMNTNKYGPPKHDWTKTHCPQGHEYTEENTKIRFGRYRECKICNRERAKFHRENKK